MEFGVWGLETSKHIREFLLENTFEAVTRKGLWSQNSYRFLYAHTHTHVHTHARMRTRTHIIILREMHTHEITRALARARVGSCVCITSTSTNSNIDFTHGRSWTRICILCECACQIGFEEEPKLATARSGAKCQRWRQGSSRPGSGKESETARTQTCAHARWMKIDKTFREHRHLRSQPCISRGRLERNYWHWTGKSIVLYRTVDTADKIVLYELTSSLETYWHCAHTPQALMDHPRLWNLALQVFHPASSRTLSRSSCQSTNCTELK